MRHKHSFPKFITLILHTLYNIVTYLKPDSLLDSFLEVAVVGVTVEQSLITYHPDG